MKLWIKLLIATAAFWALWVGIAGLAMVVHGDCGAGASDAEAAACVHQKGWVGLAAVAVGAVVYGLIIRRIVKRSRSASR
jgi:hypothetical protein